MKKTVSLLLLFFGIVLFVPGQTPEPIDLILVLDTSSSMSGVHREVIDYISGPFLKEFLKTGDTFHLISFSGSPRFEISRRIEGIGDVETILVRMFLLVPLDPYTDVAGALDYTERYVLQLPSSRPKKVVFITDGDQNPEPGTPAAVQDSRTLETRLAEAAARLRLEGTDFYQVTFPLTGSGPSSGRNPAPFRTPPPPSAPKPPQAGQQNAAPPPQAVPKPPQAEQQNTALPPPAAPKPPQAEQQNIAPPLPAVPKPPQAEQQNIAPPPQAVPKPPQAEQQNTALPPPAAPQPPQIEQQNAAPLPPAVSKPPQIEQQNATPPPPAAPKPPQIEQQNAAPLPPAASKPLRVEPSGGASGTSGFDCFPILAGLGTAAVLSLGGIIFFMIRKIKDSPNRVIAYGTEKKLSYGAGRGEEKAALLLSLVVDDQNTNIGRRNIHLLKAGDVYTIGGSKSDDYLIFLVPVPARIGEVRFDGRECTFVPKKPLYFPQTGSQPTPDCIGKILRIVSDKRYELTFHLEQYEDPQDSLNRLLNSVVLPPPFDAAR